MHESINNQCISFADGYETDTEACPDGYVLIRISNWGPTPDTYNCYKLYNKTISCPYDYLLNGNSCIKTIPATN